eukprot:10496561-Alexandrium_andersonii.AAC.1
MPSGLAGRGLAQAEREQERVPGPGCGALVQHGVDVRGEEAVRAQGHGLEAGLAQQEDVDDDRGREHEGLRE